MGRVEVVKLMWKGGAKAKGPLAAGRVDVWARGVQSQKKCSSSIRRCISLGGCQALSCPPTHPPRKLQYSIQGCGKRHRPPLSTPNEASPEMEQTSCWNQLPDQVDRPEGAAASCKQRPSSKLPDLQHLHTRLDSSAHIHSIYLTTFSCIRLHTLLLL